MPIQALNQENDIDFLRFVPCIEVADILVSLTMDYVSKINNLNL